LLINKKFDVQISEAPSDRSAQSIHHKVLALGKATSLSMSGIRIDLRKPGSNALLLENTLFLAVGQYVCALSLPQLELLWASEVDPSTSCAGEPLT